MNPQHKTSLLTCVKKRWYNSEQRAINAARHNFEKFGTKLRPYLCNLCLFWHLTKRNDNEAS